MEENIEEVLSAYEQLISFINENIPLLGEQISIWKFEFTATHILLPVVFLIITNLFANVIRSILINKVLNRYIEDRKTVLSIGNTTKYTILIIGVAFLMDRDGYW